MQKTHEAHTKNILFNIQHAKLQTDQEFHADVIFLSILLTPHVRLVSLNSMNNFSKESTCRITNTCDFTH